MQRGADRATDLTTESCVHGVRNFEFKTSSLALWFLFVVQ